MKIDINNYVDKIGPELTAMSDEIFDNPELGLEEYRASKLLCDWLEKQGFEVEAGVAGVETAFRARHIQGEGGPTIGLLCEYDALPKLGHGCGHQMQGPAILGAAASIKEILKNHSYKLVVYGTPAEESVSGKIMMIANGCTFEELDVALMMHGSGETQTDVKLLVHLESVHRERRQGQRTLVMSCIEYQDLVLEWLLYQKILLRTHKPM